MFLNEEWQDRLESLKKVKYKDNNSYQILNWNTIKLTSFSGFDYRCMGERDWKVCH